MCTYSGIGVRAIYIMYMYMHVYPDFSLHHMYSSSTRVMQDVLAVNQL